MKLLIVIIFLLMCAAQWAIPVATIFQQETLLRHGREFRFRTQPVDPTDLLRGKYITLSFQDEVVNIRGRSWQVGTEMFAVLEEGLDGFTVVSDVVDTPPTDLDYMPVTVAAGDSTYVRVRFPFDRYYLEESKAYNAERVYRDNVSDSTQRVYAIVRIKDGKTSLQDVMVNDRSIVEVVREMAD